MTGLKYHLFVMCTVVIASVHQIPMTGINWKKKKKRVLRLQHSLILYTVVAWLHVKMLDFVTFHTSFTIAIATIRGFRKSVIFKKFITKKKKKIEIP